MEKQIAFVPTYDLISRTANRYWLRNYAAGYSYYIAIPLLTLIFCLASGEMSFTGAGGALLGVLLGIVAVLVSLLVFSYANTRKSVVTHARKWKNVEMTYLFDDEGFAEQSELGCGRTSWKNIDKVRVSSDALALFSDTRTLAILPAQFLTDDLQHFILQKVVEVGGKIVR